MAFSVIVYGIFTAGARSSATAEQRRARLNADLASANQAWGSGFFPGVSCGITFYSGGTWNSSRVINASTSAGVSDPRIEALINSVRSRVAVKDAIFVVYTSGNTFSNGTSIGSGGARVTISNGVITSEYGRVALTDLAGTANNPYVFAHEAGHVLFGRLNSAGNYTQTDPSTGTSHNNDPRNLMYFIVPRTNPYINATQCITARNSLVILENNANAVRAAGAARASQPLLSPTFAATRIRRSSARRTGMLATMDRPCSKKSCCCVPKGKGKSRRAR
jgi:hypothetical protein